MEAMDEAGKYYILFVSVCKHSLTYGASDGAGDTGAPETATLRGRSLGIIWGWVGFV